MRGRAGRSLESLSANSGWILLAFLLILAGPPLMINPNEFAPGIVAATLPDLMVRLYGALFFFGGIGIIAGTIARAPNLERAGFALVLGAISVFVYLLFAVGVDGNRIQIIATYVAFGGAAVARYRHLGKQVKGMQTARELTKGDRGPQGEEGPPGERGPRGYRGRPG